MSIFARYKPAKLTLSASLTVLVLSLMAWPLLAATPPLTDQAITDAVEDELHHDSAVVPTNIDVQTVQGTVTLSGTVNHLLAQERASRIAETVKGVRTVVNKLRVQPTTKLADEAVQQSVFTALQIDPVTEAQEIKAQVENGMVTLRGTVQSWLEKQAAEQVAKGVQGVTAVTNKIDITYAEARPDQDIKAEIEHLLRWDVRVDHALIHVQVEQGTVRLTGTVGSAAEKRVAVAAAWIAGGTNVDTSGLEVAKWERTPELRQDKYIEMSNEAIQQAVAKALRAHPRVQAYDVAAEVEDGVVTLRGIVENLKAKYAAAQAARNTVGVVRIKNRLKVRSKSVRNNEALAADIRGALTRDPYVERYGLTVEVINGTAHLYGSVETLYEKVQAEDVAGRVRGIMAVKNHIRVLSNATPMAYDRFVDDDWYVFDYPWYDGSSGTTSKPDQAIAQDVKGELWWSPFVDADEVNVAVEDGVVTLSGMVDSLAEKEAATENAYEGGAVRVINKLQVE